MPPSKQGAPLTQQKLDFRAVKFPKTKGKKGQPFKHNQEKNGLSQCDDVLKRLRIPYKICKALPSLKKFVNGSMKKAGKNKDGPIKTLKQGPVVKTENNTVELKPQPLLGLKRKRGEHQKYQLKLLCEEKFEGMIWDVAFTPLGDIIVGSSEGAFLCDENLAIKRKLENVILAGGIGFLSDGRMVIICRNMDTVNFFTATGVFMKSFHASPSPMGLAINAKDEIIISDTGSKTIQIYNISGVKIREIPPRGPHYQLRWPLYLALNSNDDIILSDCHLQKVLQFNSQGKYMHTFPMATHPGNQVLRPHGVCINHVDDIFVIDTSIDTMEVFQEEGTFAQTLIASDDGYTLKPKAMRTNADGSQLIIGGMTGQVRIYKFVTGLVKQESLDSNDSYSSATTSTSQSKAIKKEPSDGVIVLD